MNRISSGFMNQQALNYLNTNLNTSSRLQEKLSTGRNINRPSDDPVGLTRILDLSKTIKTDARYSKNIDGALSESKTLDSVLGNMEELIHRAQELATQASTFSNNQDGRNAVALEIDQIINQLVQLGNTNIGGKYLFSGMKTDTPPFTRTGDDITFSGTPQTDNWQREVEVAEGVQLNINLNGDQVFGNATVSVASPPLPPTFSAGSGGLFKTLVELKKDLEADGDPAQLDEIRKRIDELGGDLNNVLAQHSRVGATINRLDLTQSRIEERKAILTQQYANIQDINMAETIADLNYQDNIFQASLGVTARLMQTSLMNFLR